MSLLRSSLNRSPPLSYSRIPPRSTRSSSPFPPAPRSNQPIARRRLATTSSSIPPPAVQSTSPTPGTQQTRGFSTSTFLTVSLILLPLTGYALGSIYPPGSLLLLFPRLARPPAPLKDDTDEGRAYLRELDAELQRLPIVTDMRNKIAWSHSEEDGEEGYYECRPLKTPLSPHSLTSSVLRQPGLLALPPLAFPRADESENIMVVHLGRSLCGHDGIIHGGVVATVFDESLARQALLNLPSKIGVTANLSVNYKKPTRADQWVLIRTKLTSKDGRKASASGTMEDLNGQLLATAEALFIEPKWAAALANSGVSAVAFGTRESPRTLDTGGAKEERRA